MTKSENYKSTTGRKAKKTTRIKMAGVDEDAQSFVEGRPTVATPEPKKPVSVWRKGVNVWTGKTR